MAVVSDDISTGLWIYARTGNGYYGWFPVDYNVSLGGICKFGGVAATFCLGESELLKLYESNTDAVKRVLFSSPYKECFSDEFRAAAIDFERIDSELSHQNEGNNISLQAEAHNLSVNCLDGIISNELFEKCVKDSYDILELLQPNAERLREAVLEDGVIILRGKAAELLLAGGARYKPVKHIFVTLAYSKAINLATPCGIIDKEGRQGKVTGATKDGSNSHNGDVFVENIDTINLISNPDTRIGKIRRPIEGLIDDIVIIMDPPEGEPNDTNNNNDDGGWPDLPEDDDIDDEFGLSNENGKSQQPGSIHNSSNSNNSNKTKEKGKGTKRGRDSAFTLDDDEKRVIEEEHRARREQMKRNQIDIETGVIRAMGPEEINKQISEKSPENKEDSIEYKIMLLCRLKELEIESLFETKSLQTPQPPPKSSMSSMSKMPQMSQMSQMAPGTPQFGNYYSFGNVMNSGHNQSVNTNTGSRNKNQQVTGNDNSNNSGTFNFHLNPHNRDGNN